MIKMILNLNLVILLEYQNIKTFRKSLCPKLVYRNFCGLKKLKTRCLGHMLLVILTGKKMLESFTKRTSQNEIRVEKVIKRKGDKLYFKWKDYDNSFNGWIDQKA